MAMESLWVFYSYEVLPVVQERVPMGIGARKDRTGVVELSLFLPSTEVSAEVAGKELTGSESVIIDAFRTEAVDRLAPEIRADLRVVSGNTDFESVVQLSCQESGLEYVGVFVDSLEDELGKIMPMEYLEIWLDSPNSAFGCSSPRTLLEPVQRSKQLRDLILSAKHGAVT